MVFSVIRDFRRPTGLDFRILEGLDLPIRGRPDQFVEPGPTIGSVASSPPDFVDLRAKLLVREGDRVALGTPLFRDRAHPEILFTSPGSGVVDAVVAGPGRSFQSVIVHLDGDEEVEFARFSRDDLSLLPAATIRRQLLDSGLWTSLRMRPFGTIPRPDSEPAAIFVRAIDTNPLAADPAVIVSGELPAFEDGLRIVSRLTSGPTYLCQRPSVELVHVRLENVRVARFEGPHPAGLVGTHVHRLRRVGEGRVVWYLDCQDAIAIGKLFRSGRLDPGRVVALGGPLVRRPRLLATRLGCKLADLTLGELSEGPSRVISGSVLSGREGGFLGRYDAQVSVLPEAGVSASGSRAPRGYSIHRLLPAPGGRERSFDTAMHGRPSALIPVGSFDRVMPLDVPVIPLLRALAVHDLEGARALGCLELEEEDLALCTYLCPGKLDYGALLRSVLSQLAKEFDS